MSCEPNIAWAGVVLSSSLASAQGHGRWSVQFAAVQRARSVLVTVAPSTHGAGRQSSPPRPASWPSGLATTRNKGVSFLQLPQKFTCSHPWKSNMVRITHCTENPIYVFSITKLCGLAPNSYIQYIFAGSVCLFCCSYKLGPLIRFNALLGDHPIYNSWNPISLLLSNLLYHIYRVSSVFFRFPSLFNISCLS